MNQIPPYALWLGNAADCRDLGSITDLEIQLVVQLAIEESIPPLPREVSLIRLPLLDGSGNDPFTLRFAINTVSEAIKSNRRTLVCCSAGLSRTPALAACAVALVNEKDPKQCLQDIDIIVHADVSPGFWLDMISIHAEMIAN